MSEEQERIHRLLTATFADDPVPELSPEFESRLDRSIEASVTVSRLRGWRLAAMWGYLVLASGSLFWLLKDVPFPAADLEAPWVFAGAFVAVPLTLWMAIAASRLLPVRGGQRL